MTRKWNNEEVYAYINEEGLSYAILHGLRVDDIEDKKLADMWRTADKALSDIERYLDT